MRTISRVPPLTDGERASLMLAIRRWGETAAAIKLGVPRQTIARALARLPQMPGTILLIRAGLAALKSELAPAKGTRGGDTAPPDAA